MSRRTTPGDASPVNPSSDGNNAAENQPSTKPSTSHPKKRSTSARWLFIVSAWACYLRWVSTSHGTLVPLAEPPIGRAPFHGSKGQGELSLQPNRSSVPIGLDLTHFDDPKQRPYEPSRGAAGQDISDSSSSSSISSSSRSSSRSSSSSSSSIDGNHMGNEVDDQAAEGAPLAMIGATLALSGKCASPDYGARLFYIKTKHTGSRTLAGILRRIGVMHAMEIADPAPPSTSFKADEDFHKVAQGRCVDLLVAHTKRAPWLDKAFKGALKVTSVREPVTRATSSYLHGVDCGAKCAMCHKLLDDQVKWARRCKDVADAQFELVKGSASEPGDAVDNYDLVAVTDRFWESLVVLRHVLGVALAEVLYIDPDGAGADHSVPLSDQPSRFLDVVASRNQLDRELYDAANAALDEKIGIIGKGAVRREAAELRLMQELAQHACTDPQRAHELMGKSYNYRKDCLWHDQGCGHHCLMRWATMYETARASKLQERIELA